jgi:tetratricopeptide (TPR) repeat protein
MSKPSLSQGQGTPLSDLPDLEGLSHDDDVGRQHPIDVDAIEAAAAQATDRLARADADGDRVTALAVLGYLGNARRLLGETEAAVRLLRRALALARKAGNGGAEAVTLIRLGEAIRYGGNVDAAEPLYREALALVPAHRDSLATPEDFTLQHLVKCRLEQGDAAEAADCLERALHLRRAKGDPALIASTETALSHASSARN